jgi:nucleotide sugar dehydrogenase
MKWSSSAPATVSTETRLTGPFPVLAEAAARQRAAGRTIVVVQGLGFVGAAVAAVVADARAADGRPPFFVIGLDLPTANGLTKIAAVAAGECPIHSSDSQLAEATRRGALEARNLTATWEARALGLADVILVDVPLDASIETATGADAIRVELEPFAEAIRAIGREMREDALVLVETTVPVGTTERVVLPILSVERQARGIKTPPLVAHAFERVTPGPNYVDSIRNCFRVFSGVDAASAERARAFLAQIVDVAEFPLQALSDTDSSEVAKLLENSYRAVNIAFIHEWTLLAERIGVNLFAVIDAIRRRRGTHDNMRYPGFGVGGYCLTKDTLLAQWGADRFFGGAIELGMSLQALRINRLMPEHTFDLVAEIAGELAGRTIAVLGASYLPDVGDARNSPSATLIDALRRAQARVRAHDPVLSDWPERPDLRLETDLEELLHGADGVVLAVAHRAYRERSAAYWVEATPSHSFFIDANDILTDEVAQTLRQTGRRVAGVGKGHWRRWGLHA